MAAHFLPCQRRWGQERRTWSMVREGKVVRSRTDYILGTDRSLFWNVSLRAPRHNTDHYMVLGCLLSAPEREHAKYLTGRENLPLQPPTEPTREDGIFAALRRDVPKPHARELRTNEWISEETWRLVDERVSARRGTRMQEDWRLSQVIASSLNRDRKKEGRDSGRGGVDVTRGGPAKPEGGLKTTKMVVQGCGQPCAAARSRYARADHGRAGRPLLICTIPRIEHPGYSKTSEGGHIGTYGGRDRGCS